MTVAVLVKEPLSISACVRTCVPLNVTASERPGPNEIGPPTIVADASLIEMFETVVLPVFSTVKTYSIVSPSSTRPSPPSLTLEDFKSSKPGSDAKGTTVGSSAPGLLVSSDKSETFGPVGGVPVAVAWFTNSPESISNWVSV